MPRNEISSRSKGLLLVLTGVLIISFDALLVRLAHTQTGNVIFWRGIFMLLSLTVVELIRNRRTPVRAVLQGGGPAAQSALHYGLGGILFVSAVMFTKVANAVVIISLAPLFAAALTRIFNIDVVTLRTWLAIISAICGVAIVFHGSLGTGDMLGNLIALLAALNIGSNLTLLRSNPRLDPLPLVALGGGIMAVLALPWAAPWDMHQQSYLVLALMGLIQMPAALVLIGTSTRYLPSPEVSLFLLVETISAPILVWLFLAEEPLGATFLGGGIVITTLVLYFWLGLRESRQVLPSSDGVPAWPKR